MQACSAGLADDQVGGQFNLFWGSYYLALDAVNEQCSGAHPHFCALLGNSCQWYADVCGVADIVKANQRNIFRDAQMMALSSL